MNTVQPENDPAISLPKKRVRVNSSNKSSGKVSALEIKRIQLELQRAHQRAERERDRLKKESERQELIRKRKLEQDRVNQERQLKKEQLEKEKEARRLQREEERIQKEKEREEERLKKEEEKRKKDEDRMSKELERQKDEEEKIRKTEKQRAILLGFLVRSEDKEEPLTKEEVKQGPFMQFQLKKNQRIAPIRRVSEYLHREKRSNVEVLKQSWLCDSTTADFSRLGLRKFGQPNYLHELRTGQIKSLSSPSTWPVEMPDVLLSGDGEKTRCSATLRYGHGDRGDGGTVWTKAKLLQFVENYRPAYYGTWRRQSVAISGRRPFAKDLLQLDYELDSDDEWEEEEPGESITQSEGEEEEEIADEDEDEDENFLVPHGYLSDDEGVDADDAEAKEGNETLEMKKLRQRLSLAEYEEAHRRGLQKLKPLLLGPIWSSNPLNGLEQTSNDFLECSTTDLNDSLEENKENIADVSRIASTSNDCVFSSNLISRGEHKLMRSALNAYRVFMWGDQAPISLMNNIDLPTPVRANGRVKNKFPDEAIPHLIHLIHKNPLGKDKLQFEFRVFWQFHSSGLMPECTKFSDYKRMCRVEKPNDNPEKHKPRCISSRSNMEILSLLKYPVLAKIGELAVFEDGRWAVKPDIISKYSDELLKFRTSVSEDSAIVNQSSADADIFLPAWNYVTDVTLVKKTSVSRKLPSEVAENVSDVLQPIIIPAGDSAHRDIVPAMDKCIPFESDSIPSLSKETTASTAPSYKTSQLITRPLELSISPKVNVSCEKLLQLCSSPGLRKRVTLETFFSPPSAKKAKSTELDAVNSGTPKNPIILD